MRILVCMKLVSQIQFTDLLNEEEKDRLKFGQLGTNPADLYALEMALRIKDKEPMTQITVLSMGPEYAEHELRNAVGMGADEALHISDPAFAGADTLRTSAVLAAAIRKVPAPDLILCGKRSMDSETGHIGPQLAARLYLPVITNVIAFSPCEDGAYVDRSQDNGILRYWAPFPLLLTLCCGADLVRNPSLAGMRRSRKADLLHLNTLSLPKSELTPSQTETIEIRPLRYAKRIHHAAANTEEAISLFEQMFGRE